MRMYDIIHKKRFGGELNQEELSFFVNGYVNNKIPDYQASALLMAICYVGMTDEETATLTSLMAASGEMLDLSAFGDKSVDKHSTGGVGDKTTLIVAPIVASLGCTVAKLSGRGLGHTGGTLDKLESIKGFRTNLSSNEFMDIADKCGLCVCGAGENLVPADKKLYALRDVTATVSSIPLIVSSIMSKKLAGGAKSIVLDVKTGSGSFMKTVEDSRELAKRMVAIGKLSGRKVSAVITNMDKPLGFAIGNSVEVREAISILKCREGIDKNLLQVCKTLSAELVSLSKNITYNESLATVENSLNSGKAYEVFQKWISLQGGDISFIESDSFGKAKYESYVCALESGYISSVNAEMMGISAMMLGAGRASKTDIIDSTAGVIQLCGVGDRVEKGQPIAKLQSTSVSNHSSASSAWLSAINISQEIPKEQPVIYETIR